jgi:hypothetical protein
VLLDGSHLTPHCCHCGGDQCGGGYQFDSSVNIHPQVPVSWIFGAICIRTSFTQNELFHSRKTLDDLYEIANMNSFIHEKL